MTSQLFHVHHVFYGSRPFNLGPTGSRITAAAAAKNDSRVVPAGPRSQGRWVMLTLGQRRARDDKSSDHHAQLVLQHRAGRVWLRLQGHKAAALSSQCEAEALSPQHGGCGVGLRLQRPLGAGLRSQRIQCALFSNLSCSAFFDLLNKA